MCPREGMEVYAFPRVLAIPILPDKGDWRAIEETCDGERDSIRGGNSHECKYRGSKLLAREYA